MEPAGPLEHGASWIRSRYDEKAEIEVQGEPAYGWMDGHIVLQIHKLDQTKIPYKDIEIREL